jgi:hypothetical protein
MHQRKWRPIRLLSQRFRRKELPSLCQYCLLYCRKLHSQTAEIEIMLHICKSNSCRYVKHGQKAQMKIMLFISLDLLLYWNPRSYVTVKWLAPLLRIREFQVQIRAILTEVSRIMRQFLKVPFVRVPENKRCPLFFK